MFGVDAAVLSAMTNHCPTDYRMHYSQTLKTTTKTKTLKLISPGKITSVLDIKDRKSIILLFSFQKCLLQNNFLDDPPYSTLRGVVQKNIFATYLRWKIIILEDHEYL